MKKILITALMITALIGSTVRAEQETEQEKEILFRDIPWGTSYTEVNDTLRTFDLWTLTGEGYRTYSINEIITNNEMDGIFFENDDINIYSTASNHEIDVAGYTTSNIELFFAYTISDGKLPRTEDDSALYGARYTFEPENPDEATADLIDKLTMIYGAPGKQESEYDEFDGNSEYVYWYGENDTELVLKYQDYSGEISKYINDTIYISYLWTKGDELLQEASDLLEEEARGNESSIYGNGSTNGL